MLRALSLCLLLVAGCRGALNGDPTEFNVRVVDGEGAPVPDAVVVLEMEDGRDNEVCDTTGEDGTVDVAWDACQFGAFDCDENPYAVRASKEGYKSARGSVGFSSARTITLTLRACDGDCDTPETCK